MAWRKI